MTTNIISRSLHDVGLAAWFGGTTANAVALNPGAAQAHSSRATGAVANVGWDRWTPVNGVAIGMHVIGSVGQLAGNRRRLASQSGVGQMAALKTGLTVAALGVTAYSRMLGRRVSSTTHVPAASGTEPSEQAPADVVSAQRQLAVLQWAVPVLTAALVVLSAFAGEQQRPASVTSGVLHRLTPGR